MEEITKKELLRLTVQLASGVYANADPDVINNECERLYILEMMLKDIERTCACMGIGIK